MIDIHFVTVLMRVKKQQKALLGTIFTSSCLVKFKN
ncbi:hypothetical protein M2372_001767 [Chryseobacterium sp. BIGb0232]|nr:hypothetical protein [Chryseobacterium sp. BIGb0232]ROS18272.1 hypothetical protein EDF65_2664 [Chryseobacterium nakagawai]